jgi:CCR4-NOT transcription complex subunit 9
LINGRINFGYFIVLIIKIFWQENYPLLLSSKKKEMHLAPHHNNPQIQQYLQLQQAAASALAAPNPLNVGGANNLSSQLHGSASNLHGLPMGSDPWGTGAGTPLSLPVQHQHKLAQLEEEKIYSLIIELTNPANREQALVELSKKREQYDDLALILWHSFGIFHYLVTMNLFQSVEY